MQLRTDPEESRTDKERMKKKLFSVILILAAAVLLCGCTAKQAEDMTGEVVPAVSYSYFELHLKLIEEAGGTSDATGVIVFTDGEEKVTADAADGVAVIGRMPCKSDIVCNIRKGGALIATCKLSFWTGYALAYYNNLDTVNVDMPGNVQALYMTLRISEDSSVDCESLSETGFDDAGSASSDFEGAVDEATAISAGLYGSRAISEGGVNLREAPSTDGAVLRKMNFADSVMLLDQGSPSEQGITWFKVKYDEYEGYISGEYLGRLYTVNSNGVNIRESASAESKSVYLVGEGTRVVAMDEGTEVEEYKWYQVRTRSGHSGYIRSDFLF